MDPELKKMNKMLLEFKPKKKLGPVFRKIIAFVLLIAVLTCLSLFTPLFKEREIVISGQKGGKTIINLGYLGLIFPSGIKNKERVNLLFLGIPGKGHQGPELTDSIIILNSTPKAKNPIGISIPRDLFVKNPDKNIYTKVNAIYQGSGIETIKIVLKEITDLDIDYFIILDLQGVKKLIDLVDGIDVLNENDIYDPQFPGPNDSYTTFSLKKGIHHLDGETALKYIRTRHQPGGDFGRIKRQQQVINLSKDKIFSLNVFQNFPTLLKVWKTLNKHIHTNIGLTDIKYAWNLAKKTNFDEIKFITLSNQPGEQIQLLVSDHVILGNTQAYILKPRAGIGNYEEIRDYIANLVNQD